MMAENKSLIFLEVDKCQSIRDKYKENLEDIKKTKSGIMSFQNVIKSFSNKPDMPAYKTSLENLPIFEKRFPSQQERLENYKTEILNQDKVLISLLVKSQIFETLLKKNPDMFNEVEGIFNEGQFNPFLIKTEIEKIFLESKTFLPSTSNEQLTNDQFCQLMSKLSQIEQKLDEVLRRHI